MKACSNCSQYHNQTEINAHKCFTYQKYTYLLKDEFLKWSKQQTKQSKTTEKSKINQLRSHDKTQLYQNTLKESQSKTFYRPQQFDNSSKMKPYPLNNLGVINKRIEKVINKSKRCKQHHKNCSHLKSTQVQEMHSSSVQQLDHSKLDQKYSQSFQEHQTAITLSVMPCQRLFEKPFNSKLLHNPIVYDSLRDNRICGIQLCDEGEVEGTNERIMELYGKWKIY